MGYHYFHQDDPEAFLEVYKEEAAEFTKMMQILDGSLICANLPPVTNSEALFKMTEDLRYLADGRYRKKKDIKDDTFDVYDTTSRDKMLDQMRNILKEEVTKYFDQLSGMAK
mgnify:CR=1 FL=1